MTLSFSSKLIPDQDPSHTRTRLASARRAHNNVYQSLRYYDHLYDLFTGRLLLYLFVIKSHCFKLVVARLGRSRHAGSQLAVDLHRYLDLVRLGQFLIRFREPGAIGQNSVVVADQLRIQLFGRVRGKWSQHQDQAGQTLPAPRTLPPESRPQARS